MASDEKDPRIAQRDNWLKIGVVAFFSLIVGYKLITTPIPVNLADFNFSDLLSVALGIFAVSISIAFYFKATDTSNHFYDNTYKFTNHISETLGRIEERFGERLRHIDEGYVGIRALVDRMPIDPEKAEKEIKQEEAEVQKKEKERDRTLEDLAKRAKLEDAEKQTFFQKFREQDEAISAARRDIMLLERTLAESRQSDVAEQTRPALGQTFVASLTHDLGMSASQLEALTPAQLEEMIVGLNHRLSRETISVGRFLGVFDRDMRLVNPKRVFQILRHSRQP